MAGLTVLLEPPNGKSHHPGIWNGKKQAGAGAQIISKATLVIHGPNNSRKKTAAGSSFLQRCCLCHKELAEGTDIYMYRGDRAFCSEECRCRQIFMDEEAATTTSSSCCCEIDGAGATTVRGRRRVAGRGRVAY